MAEAVQQGAPGLLERWRGLRDEVEGLGARLLAVSKYAPEDAVAALVAAGQQDFAESRPQQLRDRVLRYPSARWHMIGPLQKNKAKYIARHAAMWHSVEDLETARAVDVLVEGRRLPVLVQVNVAGIAHQHGVAPADLPELLTRMAQLPNLQIAGLMCMAPRDDEARACFAALRGLRDGLGNGSLAWTKLSLCMGMSGDYRMAIDEGADIVRIGSGLFEAT
ncbi:MAG: YggS family pyridoxal phosphate-dependent enzyme [Zetaproteobacteria bacterium CG_4_8_14_3_um_filter_59_5]|nr:MAG: YggS family pyridoxal phosphate-dependent enzyme [Zetaproteobacteria bacterium CG_4_8_14_3_um_filter_59_5]